MGFGKKTMRSCFGVKRARLCWVGILLLCGLCGGTVKAGDEYAVDRPVHRNHIKQNEDGTYTLTLDVAGQGTAQTRTSYQGVTIKDTLSEYVQIVDEEKIKVEATGASGKKLKLPKKTKVVYDEETKTLTVAFPKNYTLRRGATYSVRVRIRSTEAALKAYAKEGGYPNVGEEGTGKESAGKEGFYCNTNAYVTYNGTSSGYPHPVIQVAKETAKALDQTGYERYVANALAGGIIVLVIGAMIIAYYMFGHGERPSR